MPELSNAGFFALFLAGLLGGTHCVGMCGGIVGALAMQGRATLPTHLAYNLGRIASYALAGALAGAVGHAFGSLLPIQRGLYLFASLMLLAMGAHLLGFTRALTPVERAGRGLWARIQPLTGRFLPVRGAAQAFPLGLLWGWLPCGLVYGALATALAAGSAGGGAMAMIAFGLGTLPNLLLAGLLLARFRLVAQARATRIVSGMLVLGFGFYGLVNGMRALFPR